MQLVPETERRDSLIVECQGFVKYIALKLIEDLELPRVLLDEMVAAGNLGLVEAAGRFEFDTGREFKFFAFLRIKGAIIDGLRNCSDLSRRAYGYARALDAAQSLRETDFPDRKIKQTRKEKLCRILEYANKGALAFRISMAEAEKDCCDLFVAEENPEILAIRREEAKLFRKLVAELPENERKIIEEYYYQNKQFNEIEFNARFKSKSWASRVHSRALRKLREKYLQSEE